jgi:hypothetical protein
MTAKESTESETYTVDAVAKNGATPVTLEDFLVGKLGHSSGKKLYKELVSAVKDCTKTYDGSPAIDLDTRRGSFVVLKQAS